MYSSKSHIDVILIYQLNQPPARLRLATVKEAGSLNVQSLVDVTKMEQSIKQLSLPMMGGWRIMSGWRGILRNGSESIEQHWRTGTQKDRPPCPTMCIYRGTREKIQRLPGGLWRRMFRTSTPFPGYADCARERNFRLSWTLVRQPSTTVQKCLLTVVIRTFT